MEFFNKSKIIKLRSHLDKYLIIDDNHIGKHKLRQSRNGTVRRAQWTIEQIENNPHLIRLKSYNGKYLTATETPFPLSLTAKTVILTELENGLDGKNEWEPIRDGFQVKLRSWCGKYLKGNGGAPPWRNSITIDDALGSVKMDSVLWDVEDVIEEKMNEVVFERMLSSFTSSNDVSFNSDAPSSPMSVFSLGSPPARGNSQVSFQLCFIFYYFIIFILFYCLLNFQLFLKFSMLIEKSRFIFFLVRGTLHAPIPNSI
jgi:tetrahydromethanopterin S-methyltransferase subunit B